MALAGGRDQRVDLRLPADLDVGLAEIAVVRQQSVGRAQRLRHAGQRGKSRFDLALVVGRLDHIGGDHQQVIWSSWGKTSRRRWRWCPGRGRGAGEVQLPGLRGHHPAAGAAPCHRARARRPGPAGDDRLRQVRHAPAAHPAEPGHGRRGHRARCLDAGRRGGKGLRHAGAATGAHPGSCARRRAAAWRRHHGAGAGQEEDRGGADLDLCPRCEPCERHWSERAWRNPSAAAARRRHSSITPATVAALTPGATRPGGAGYSRPTLMPASTASMRRDARRRRSPRPHAGPTAVPGSSSWPISPRPCGRRWSSRRCGASTRSSPPSVVLAGCVRQSSCPISRSVSTRVTCRPT